MSLWHKPASLIEFSDVDAFCQTMQPEGARLDYKGVAFPKDLAKTIAAFANTLGGLIILGVEADSTLNKPIWPPTLGLPAEAGLSERVIQIAQDGIYPPVGVAVSSVIPNDLLPGHVLLVIRVNESREAPHAVDKNRRVYVYERVDNKSEPYELADMDRIQYLLARRQRLVDQRESDLRENLARGQRVMHSSICPIRWISISPVYPWRNIHDQYDCKGFHQQNPLILFDGGPAYQTVVGGSFCLIRRQQEGGAWIPVACSSVSANGTLFGMTYTQETPYDNKTLFRPDGREERGKMWVNMRNFREMIEQFLDACQKCYSLSKNPPGEILLSVGMKNALGVLMHDTISGQSTDSAFPDPEYRVDLVLQSQALGPRMPEIQELYNDIIFAFNANARPR
jgi:Putative DNA-binding domain